MHWLEVWEAAKLLWQQQTLSGIVWEFGMYRLFGYMLRMYCSIHCWDVFIAGITILLAILIAESLNWEPIVSATGSSWGLITSWVVVFSLEPRLLGYRDNINVDILHSLVYSQYAEVVFKYVIVVSWFSLEQRLHMHWLIISMYRLTCTEILNKPH